MLCFCINHSFKLSPCFESLWKKHSLDAQEAGTDQPHRVWMPEFDCGDPLCYLKTPHKCGFDASLQIQTLQHMDLRRSSFI